MRTMVATNEADKVFLDLAVAAIETRLRIALRLAWDVARKPEAPAVHRLRTSCRRLRTAIALFDGVAALPQLFDVDEAARRMAKAVADLRAKDVAVERLGRLSLRSRDPGFKRLCREVAESLGRDRRAQAREQRCRIRKRAKGVEKAIVARIPLLREGAPVRASAGADPSARGALGAKVAALHATAQRRIEKAVGGGGGETDNRKLDARLHRVRIAIKHWRYAEEIAASAAPDVCTGGARLKKLQELGGTTQDLADLTRLVRRELKRRGKKGRAAAALLGAVGTLREAATRRFVEALKRETEDRPKGP
jgi:CHAD domain-containing protein